MNKPTQSIAIIRKLENAKYQQLICWSDKKQQWEFVVCDRLEDESLMDSTKREVGWRLNLDPKRDFLVSNMALLTVELGDGSDEDSRTVAFYPVQIYRAAVLSQLADSDDCRWVTAQEICRGQTADLQPIDPLVVDWINKWQVLQPWQ